MNIDIEAFKRLNSGDLKHIGDAIAKGEAIEFYYKDWREFDPSLAIWKASAEKYRSEAKDCAALCKP